MYVAYHNVNILLAHSSCLLKHVIIIKKKNCSDLDHAVHLTVSVFCFKEGLKKKQDAS